VTQRSNDEDDELRLLTQREAARLLRVSVSTIYRLRMSGNLAAIEGRPVRIAESELRRYIQQNQSKEDRQTWRDKAKALASNATGAATTKSGGPSAAGVGSHAQDAFQQGRKISRKHKRRLRAG
jgi:excisionase family DNA binding protein